MILDRPVLKNESGIFVDPSIIEQKQNILKQTESDHALEKYNKRYTKNLEAPIPNIKVPYSFILTRATPPEMQGYTESGLLIKEMKVDVRLAKKLAIMSENVSDEQEVLLIGPYVNQGIELEPGDKVKINYNKYRTLNDDHASGVIETQYEIPLYEIDGNEYLLLDSRDIIYVIPQTK